MNSDGEGDSRTSTVGRKRQRGAEEHHVSTPAEKKSRVESEDGEIDSHYSPSPEVHLDWNSREASQQPPDQRSPPESGEVSRSLSPQQASDFPHMAVTPGDSPAPNATREAYAVGLDGTSDDPPAPESTQPSQVAANQSGPSKGSEVQLTPVQKNTIEKFEQKRAEQILRTPLPAAKEIRNSMAYAVIKVPLSTPDKSRIVPKKTAHMSIVRWIGKVAPTGLLGVYFQKNNPQSTIKALTLYRSRECLAYLENAVAGKKAPFSWDGFDFVADLTLVKHPEPAAFVSHPDTKSPHQVSPFSAALASASQYLIESGAMALKDYDAYQREGILYPKKVNPKRGMYGVGYFGELAEVNGRPLEVWALTNLANGAALSTNSSRPAINGDHGPTEDADVGASASAPDPESSAGPVSISGTSTAATTPHTSGTATSEADESAEETYEPPETVRAEQRTTLAHLSQPEREMQHRYFGAADPSDAVHCLTCGKEGHMEEDCPSRTCKFCQMVDVHFSRDCPTRVKCRKCRERGHTIEECTSKLFRSKADGIVCDYCQSKEHFEDQCTWIWRTFNPDELPRINKVDRLSVGCYFCGSDGHWGDDCRMLPKENTKYQFDVFSAKEANRYLIDPSARPSNGTLNGGFSIKGSAQGNPIDLDEDDDDADEMANFYRNVRPSNSNRGGRANIRINTGGGGNQRDASNNRHQRRSRSPPSTRSGNYRQRGGDSSQFQPINNGGFHALPPNPYGPPVSASRGGRGGGGQVLGRGGARNGRGRGGGNSGSGGGGRGGGGPGYGPYTRGPPPPPPPPAPSSSSSSRGRGRKNRNKK